MEGSLPRRDLDIIDVPAGLRLLVEVVGLEAELDLDVFPHGLRRKRARYFFPVRRKVIDVGLEFGDQRVIGCIENIDRAQVEIVLDVLEVEEAERPPDSIGEIDGRRT